MVEEVEEKICPVAEETEVPISGEEATASIIVIMNDVGPTAGNGTATSDIMIMSLQVKKCLD